MINKDAIDPNALKYYRMLKAAGFSAYFVGGSVRDLLLGKAPKDFDIATNATPHQIRRVIPGGRIIGRRFRHVMLERDGERYEIVTFRGPVVHPGEDTEERAVDAPHIEGEEPSAPDTALEPAKKTFPDLNQFGTAEQDALRRDFTINALFYDPDVDELVDYVEGKIDVDRKTLRTIGDPSVRMEEDPIRILRAARHRCKLDLAYDSGLEAAMREKAPLLESTSKDRIREEFLKVSNDQSLGTFLGELRDLNILVYAAPWFAEISDELWDKAVALWKEFAAMDPAQNISADIGISLMMTPLIGPLVLEPYSQGANAEDGRLQLPDMKYFLSVDKLRDYLLRNLRISRAQTDHVIRALFYWSRMTGLWLENGPPRRIIGKLFHHPPAVLAAKMARLQLKVDGKETPAWMNELADYSADNRRERRPQREREEVEPRQEEPASDDRAPQQYRERRPRRDDENREESHHRPAKTQRLEAPTEPMVWNGPLHAPVLRPIFKEEATNRWARKDQSIIAFRPSGIPNPPTDYAALKSHLVSNYKPELTTSQGDETSERRPNRERRPRGRGRDRARGGPRNESNESNDSAPINAADEAAPRMPPPQRSVDEDSIGNTRRPGEPPAALAHLYGSAAPTGDWEDSDEDNIGNRLDAPAPKHHTDESKEVFLTTHMIRNNQNRGGQHGGSSRNQPRDGAQRRGRGGRGRRGGRGGGGGRGGNTGGGNRGPSNPQG